MAQKLLHPSDWQIRKVFRSHQFPYPESGFIMSDLIVEASNYRLTATIFRENARRLRFCLEAEERPLVGNRIAIPYYFLISHAAELYLKCALLKRGISPKKLKEIGLRHNLNALLVELQKIGVPFTDKTVLLMNKLSAQHKTHALRYTALFDNGEATFTPLPDDIEYMLDELLMAGRIELMESNIR